MSAKNAASIPSGSNLNHTHVVYDNFILENKIEEFLSTKLDLAQYATHDDSLEQSAGMTKTVNKYNATGNVEDLKMGEGNTDDIEVSFESEDYTVGITQGRFPYYDEEVMTDPMVVDVGLKKLSAQMVNDLTSKIVAELNKTGLVEYGCTWTFNNIVDAISIFNIDESEEGLFLLINPKQTGDFRKNLKDDLKYVEDFLRTGYIGTVCGVPVIATKAVPEGQAFLATKEAVTIFTKKGSEIEQERDANIRLNKVYARKVMLVALTDGTKVVRLSSNPLVWEAVVSPTGNPKELGYSERSGSAGSYVYTLTTDTTVDGTKTYYHQVEQTS